MGASAGVVVTGMPVGMKCHVAPPGYGSPFPIYRGQLTQGMYYKPIWTQNRDHKLAKLYREVTKDGVIKAKEIKHVLHKFGYHVSESEAQWILLTLDLNHDGHISWEEFRFGIQQFCMSWPRTLDPKKAYKHKPHYDPRYNWTTHPQFPRHLGHLWSPVMM
eukprot:TRINITY_DN2534_c0_g1_i2.p2 TRINITY_DN2534_c0_g1~~TRINITY_DN2534_c0_g1_i2.p2  ORF type:complete len:161 (-),score=33.47 TRINITY_DN2534_c0_g1_i2:122-604(-)